MSPRSSHAGKNQAMTAFRTSRAVDDRRLTLDFGAVRGAAGGHDVGGAVVALGVATLGRILSRNFIRGFAAMAPAGLSCEADHGFGPLSFTGLQLQILLNAPICQLLNLADDL
jgi:hypothetical protein